MYVKWAKLQIYLETASKMTPSQSNPAMKLKADLSNIGSHIDCHWNVTEYVFEAVKTLACVEPEGTAVA